MDPGTGKLRSTILCKPLYLYCGLRVAAKVIHHCFYITWQQPVLRWPFQYIAIYTTDTQMYSTHNMLYERLLFAPCLELRYMHQLECWRLLLSWHGAGCCKLLSYWRHSIWLSQRMQEALRVLEASCTLFGSEAAYNQLQDYIGLLVCLMHPIDCRTIDICICHCSFIFACCVHLPALSWWHLTC